MTPTTSPTPRRRLFRFSLRTLLVVVVLLSVGLGWFAFKMRQAERQRKAVEKIREAGGVVWHDCDLYERMGAYAYGVNSLCVWGQLFTLDISRVTGPGNSLLSMICQVSSGSWRGAPR